MADNSIIDLPLNEDGTGYDREAVDAYLAQMDAHFTATNEEYERTISGLEANTDMAQTTHILTNASNTAQAYVEDARNNAAATLLEANKEADAIKKAAEKEAARRLSAADRTGRERLMDADRRAGNAIEEALTKVQSLVRSAQEKLRDASARAEKLTNEAERKYADAVSAAGRLTVDAEEYSKNKHTEADEYEAKIRKDINELSASTRLTADRILNEAQAEAIRLRRDAEVEYDEKMASITADLATGRMALEHFQNYYDDSLARLHAFYGGKMSEVEALAQFRFPDGYDETEREGEVPEEDEAPQGIDFSQFNGADAAEYDDSEPPAHLSAGMEQETISIDDMEDLDDMINAATNPNSSSDFIEFEDDDVIDLEKK